MTQAGRFTIAVASIAGGAAVLAVAAFGLPDVFWSTLAQVTGVERLLPTGSAGTVRIHSSRWPQDTTVLPAAVRQPLEGTSRVARLRELRAHPAIQIETATLVIPPGSETVHIVTPSLTLRDATLVTNGATLDIETEHLDATNSIVRAFSDDDGVGGRDGGTVRIVVRGTADGVLRIDLSGQAGVPGAAGPAGAPGRDGAGGAKARSGPIECLAASGRGDSGRQGGPGGIGSNGSNGGNGGTLELYAGPKIADHIQFSAPGGQGGAGGPGGGGGSGGAGGRGGEPAGVCFGNGTAGTDGTQGLPGPRGAGGTGGNEGAMHINPVED